MNTSAAGGLTYNIADDVPERHLQELILVEDDKFEDDIATRVQVTGPTMSANGYTFAVTSSYSLTVGLAWFFSTGIGKAIAIGFGVAVFVIILSMISI